MPFKQLTAGRWLVGAGMTLAILFAIQVAVALAAGPETFAAPQIVAQVPTPTPFRFLTPTPFVPSKTTTTTTATTTPRAGGFPMELAVPALAGGLAAIGGGTLLFRRKRSS
ncbi:MAG TPA: hypothetical protein VKV73_10340 [Chloroflexota bacterium]|nr:hypothetical protein [Chloroflexota bacterium]